MLYFKGRLIKNICTRTFEPKLFDALTIYSTQHLRSKIKPIFYFEKFQQLVKIVVCSVDGILELDIHISKNTHYILFYSIKDIIFFAGKDNFQNQNFRIYPK